MERRAKSAWRGGKFLSKRLGIDSLLHVLIKLRLKDLSWLVGVSVSERSANNFEAFLVVENVEQIPVSVSA